MNIRNLLNGRHKTVKDTGLYLLASIIPMVLLIVINPFLAKGLSPFDYAIIGYLSSFAAIETPLIQFFIIRYYLSHYYKVGAEDREKIKATVLQLLIVFSFLMTMIVGGGICCYHYLLNGDSTIPLFPLLIFSIGAIWIGGLYSFQLAEYRIERRTKEYCIYCIASGVFKVAIIFLCVVLLKQGAWGYEFATFLSAFTFFAITFYRLRTYIFQTLNRELIKKLFIFCWPLAFAGCLEFFTDGYSRILLERVGNNDEYGIYCVGNQFAKYINIFTMTLYSTFNPDLYESVANHNKKKLFKVCGVILGTEIIVVLLYVLLAPFAIDILTAGRYVESVSYSQILAFAQIFVVGFYLMNDVTVAAGFSKVVLSTKIIASTISIFILGYVVNKWEFYGAAYGQILIFMVFILINFVYVIRKIKKQIFYG